jgi:hypothetical protein
MVNHRGSRVELDDGHCSVIFFAIEKAITAVVKPYISQLYMDNPQ